MSMASWLVGRAVPGLERFRTTCSWSDPLDSATSTKKGLPVESWGRSRVRLGESGISLRRYSPRPRTSSEPA